MWNLCEAKLLCGLMAVVGTACSPPVTGPGGSSLPPSTAHPAAPGDGVPTASAAAAPKLETAAQLLTDAPATLKQDLLFLAGVCETAVARLQPRGQAPPGLVTGGCACCPPFQACPPKPGAPPVVRHGDDARDIYPLRHRQAGSFSAAGKNEIAATFYGCETGADNRGGTLVLDNSGSARTLVAYRSGVNTDGCEVAKRNGAADHLVCHWSDGQGASGYTRIVTVDLSAPQGLGEVTTLLQDSTCLLNAGFPYVMTKLDKLSLGDKNDDGLADITLHVQHQGGTISEHDIASCRGGDGDVPLNPTTLAPPKRYQLVYWATPQGYVASPSTKRLTTQLYQARADFWRKLEGG